MTAPNRKLRSKKSAGWLLGHEDEVQRSANGRKRGMLKHRGGGKSEL